MENIDWYNIAHRANIEMFHYRDKHIFLYDDHRTILNVLFEASKIVEDKRIPNLIYFDKHDDACQSKPKSVLLEKMGRNSFEEVTSKDFWSFVEFDLGVNDDDWLLTGMELGLINNAVVIGQSENDNIITMPNNTYISEDNIEHKLFAIPHLKYSISNRGCIGDSCIKDPKDNIIRSIFQYNTDKYREFEDEIYPFILDFDLDCFTTDCNDKVYAWPEKIFANEFDTYNGCGYFLWDLINRSQFITICREPECCGGIGESNKILGYLDKYIFNGSLGTEPIY